MQPRTPKLLEDIRDARQFILDVVTDIAVADFKANRMLCQAVERNFEIIGEAMNRIRKADPSTARDISGYPQIVAFRNVLIHAYDSIDHDVVWHVIQGNLPGLLGEVEQLLTRHRTPPQ